MTIPTPEFVIANHRVLPIEINMDDIEGKYADGEWNDLIHDTVKNWVATKQFQGRGTIWNMAIPSVNFGHPCNACFIAAFGMPDFMQQLMITLKQHFPKQVRRSDEALVSRNHWVPYLHLEQGNIYTAIDGVTWGDLEELKS